ncbi:hypothetical protein D3C83_209760 [compost metagenome]
MWSAATPAAQNLPPPNRLPRPLAIFEPTPRTLLWKVDRKPFPHLSQLNSN